MKIFPMTHELAFLTSILSLTQREMPRNEDPESGLVLPDQVVRGVEPVVHQQDERGVGPEVQGFAHRSLLPIVVASR